MAIPSRDQIDEYIATVEEYVQSSFTSVVPDIPAISEHIHNLWYEITRFGPPELPDIPFPSLGTYELPPPPPPPPPPPVPTAWYEDLADWATQNRRLVGAACVVAVGAGLLAGYSSSKYLRSHVKAKAAKRTVGSGTSQRTLVVGELPSSLPEISNQCLMDVT